MVLDCKKPNWFNGRSAQEETFDPRLPAAAFLAAQLAQAIAGREALSAIDTAYLPPCPNACKNKQGLYAMNIGLTTKVLNNITGVARCTIVWLLVIDCEPEAIDQAAPVLDGWKKLQALHVEYLKNNR
jgi:hypothetical protein